MGEREKDDVEFCGIRDSDVAVFGGSNKFLLVSTFNLYIIDYRYIYFGLYTYALGSIRFD